MSKYPFFAKKGRPSASEREICRKINNLVYKDEISKQDISDYVQTNGVPETQEELEILYSFMTGEEPKVAPKKVKEEYPYDEEYEADYQEEPIKEKPKMAESKVNSGEPMNDPINFTPFEEPVIQRSYTQGVFSQEPEEDIPMSDGAGVQFDDTDMRQPIEEDIPEPDWAGGYGGGSTASSQSQEDSSEGMDEDYEDGGKLGGDNLEDLSPAQKRKSAEKTAEAILNMYCQFAPLPFKKWASISDGKVQKMVFENRIDLNMPLENNVNVKDYIDGVNEQVNDIFQVTEETKNEIKDPLIDVLLEQELALTPTQRLLMAVGSHVVTMGFSAYQLAQNNKVALDTFARYHAQMQGQNNPRPSQTTSTNTQKNTEPTQTTSRPVNPSNDFNVHDQEAVEKLMREMVDGAEDDIIDADNDPTIEVSEDYD